MSDERTRQVLESIEGLLNDWLRAAAVAARSFGLSYKQLRESRRKRGSGGTHTRKQWDALKKFYNHTCLRCGQREPQIRLTRDHMKPLAAPHRGSNDISNIQPLCEECGNLKSDAHTDYRNSPIAQAAMQAAKDTHD